MARPFTPPPLNGMAIKRRIFFCSFPTAIYNYYASFKILSFQDILHFLFLKNVFVEYVFTLPHPFAEISTIIIKVPFYLFCECK